MSLQKNLLTKTFEALLNAATQTPTDDVMNRDGINLMLQGFELIMQAHGFTGVDTIASVVQESPYDVIGAQLKLLSLQRKGNRMPEMTSWEFGMNQMVQITRSGEVGYVSGRAEYKNAENQFYVKFTTATGTSATGWFDASDLTSEHAK
ncbi:hypothetical protein HLP44_000702 [Shigella sonnei]|nr:hypothetical protein [Shigella sonnei]